jgi:3'-phosphoadenosine 5'-phosphosulfate sulfotransferase (PAPS reductase)/FAD synthetase
MIDKLSKVLNCQDYPLLTKIRDAIDEFGNMPPAKYHLAFSGGKDSHALLIVFLLWKKLSNSDTFNFRILFADTRLELDGLYKLIDSIEGSIDDVRFDKVLPTKSYWYYQFAYGYPVPDNFNRWCTGRLKIDPMNLTKSIAITGRHFGESAARDERLSNGCSSGECGVDKIKDSYDPIKHFRDCDVWDLIFYADGTVLYEGVFNALKSTYDGSTSDKGSLRMGCFMCPVIGMKTLRKNDAPYGVEFREILEELRKSRRINNPRTKKAGAIYIDDRRYFWTRIPKHLLLVRGYITESEIQEIDNLLASDYSYPKTYTKKWIDSEHSKILGTKSKISLLSKSMYLP